MANKISNSSLVTSYMKHASAFGKVSTLASEVAKNGAFSYVPTDLIKTMASLPRHDFSQMINAVARLSNQGFAFSNTYKFAPFFNHISSTINSSFVDNLSEYIRDTDGDNLEEIDELHEEDIQVEIKRPHFFDMALKINIVVNVTDAEANGNLNEEEVSTWKKVLLPVLTVLGQLFLAWAMSDTPLHETNIYKSVDNIIHYIDTMDIDFDNQKKSDLESQK